MNDHLQKQNKTKLTAGVKLNSELLKAFSLRLRQAHPILAFLFKTVSEILVSTIRQEKLKDICNTVCD